MKLRHEIQVVNSTGPFDGEVKLIDLELDVTLEHWRVPDDAFNVNTARMYAFGSTLPHRLEHLPSHLHTHHRLRALQLRSASSSAHAGSCALLS